MKFKGIAKSVGICKLIVEADSLEEATKLIEETDGGDWEDIGSEGYFQIDTIEKIEEEL